jgi:hypothetical protein
MASNCRWLQQLSKSTDHLQTLLQGSRCAQLSLALLLSCTYCMT